MSAKLDRLDQDYQNAVECDDDDYLVIWDEWRALYEEEKGQPCDPS